MAAECCSSCEYQRTVGYPSTSWAFCFILHVFSYSYSSIVQNVEQSLILSTEQTVVSLPVLSTVVNRVQRSKFRNLLFTIIVRCVDHAGVLTRQYK